MAIRPNFDPYGGRTPVVDSLVGDAYPTVKAVACHLPYLVYLAQNFTALRPLNVEFQKNDVTQSIDWRYVEEGGEWQTLLPYTEINGPSTEMQEADGYIQYRPVGTDQWINILPVDEITGKTAEMQLVGNSIQWRLEGESWNTLYDLTTVITDSSEAKSVSATTAAQLVAVSARQNELEAGQQTSSLYFKTVALMNASPGTFVGQGAFVPDFGQYRWTGTAWEFLRSDTLAQKLDSDKVPEVKNETRESIGVIQSSSGTGSGTVEVILDSNGESRIVTVYPESDADPVFNGETPNAWKADSFGIAKSIESTMVGDPDRAELIIDAEGELRVLQAYGERIGGPVIFGTGGSNPSPQPKAAPTEFVVFLIAGQSNAQGVGNPAVSPLIPEGVAYQFYNGVLTPAIKDPIGNADTASAWPSFAIEFFQRTGLGVIFVPAAVGNSGLTVAASNSAVGGTSQNWTSPTGLRNTAMTRLRAAMEEANLAGLAWRFGGVLWSQGERDSRCLPNATSNPGVITEAEYRTAFENLVSYFNSQIGYSKWPFIVSMTGGDTEGIDADALASMRALQRRIATEVQQVRLGWTGAFNLIGRNLMRWHDFPSGSSNQNRSHYSQQGYNEMGAAMAVVASTIAV